MPTASTGPSLPAAILAEGEGDPPQLYSLAAVAYESLMVGMHQIHRGPKNEICAGRQVLPN